MPKSTYGEGTTWYDKGRDLWFGQMYWGPRNRPKVSSRKRSDMLAKFVKLQEGGPTAKVEGTTGEWIDRWLDQVKRTVEESTHEDYCRWARLYVKPHVGAIPLDVLDADDVDDMMSALEAQGIAPKTVQLARTLLVSALDVAQRRGKVPGNVARLTKGPKRVRARINDRLDAKQADAVLAALRGDRLYALAVLALTWGIRPGELFGLRWTAINLRTGTIKIEANLQRRRSDGSWYIKDPKTEASKRPLPLPAFVLAALKEHQALQRQEKLYVRDGFVFCDKAGEPLKARDVLTWWHETTIAAGVGRRRFYCSRHSAATLMLNNGVPLEVVSKILGHAGYAITSDVYAEVQDDLVRDAADIMNGVLGGAPVAS